QHPEERVGKTMSTIHLGCPAGPAPRLLIDGDPQGRLGTDPVDLHYDAIHEAIFAAPSPEVSALLGAHVREEHFDAAVQRGLAAGLLTLVSDDLVGTPDSEHQ